MRKQCCKNVTDCEQDAAQSTPIVVITNDDRGCREVLNYLKKGETTI